MAMNTEYNAYLASEQAQSALKTIYGNDAPAQQSRYAALAQKHVDTFGQRSGLMFASAPGRTEVAGNHTDHNNGRVLAAAVNLDTIAAVTPNDTGVVTLYSQGYDRPFIVNLSELTPNQREHATTTAIIRGVAARMHELGYKIGGFDAVVTSSVFKGSGLSSSAAFEVMVCAIFDGLYNGFIVPAVQRAEISQYAENVFFGKPSGLMDQMASSVGGLVAIDFGGAVPEITAMKYDFAGKGYVPCVVTVGGEHGSLTAEYAAIPAEMKSIAQALGGQVLHDIKRERFLSAIPSLKGQVKDRAILRAMHFYDENERVSDAVNALQSDDITAFMGVLTASGESSWMLLQNLYVPGSDNQEMPLALELSRRMLQGKGAWRIHGGGFAGTILAFVPAEDMPEYTRAMNAVFGDGAVTPLVIRSVGAAIV